MNVLAIGCHPDDLEIACGGTLAKLAKRGDKVFMCRIANGNMGHRVIEPEELRLIRIREAENAAKVLGCESLLIDVGDLYVHSFDDIAQDKLIDVIRYTRPDYIITHNPQDYMRDHIQASDMAFSASFAAGISHHPTQHDFIDNIPPIYYMDTLAGVGFIPTEYVDISDCIEQKLEALACHKSQIDWMLLHDKIDFIDFVRTCSKYRGLQCGVAFAEGFRACFNWPRMVARRLLP